jgi:hypothetical protein
VAVHTGARGQDASKPDALFDQVNTRQVGRLGQAKSGQFIPVALPGRVAFNAPKVFGFGLLQKAPQLFLLRSVQVLQVDSPAKNTPEVARQVLGLGARLPPLQPLKAFAKAIG